MITLFSGSSPMSSTASRPRAPPGRPAGRLRRPARPGRLRVAAPPAPLLSTALRMRISVAFPGMCLYPGGVDHWARTITTDQISTIARRLDELGFDQLLVSEHLIMHRSRV